MPGRPATCLAPRAPMAPVKASGTSAGLRSAAAPRRQHGRQVRGRGPVAFEPSASAATQPGAAFEASRRTLFTEAWRSVWLAKAEGPPAAGLLRRVRGAGPPVYGNGRAVEYGSGAQVHDHGRPAQVRGGIRGLRIARWQHDHFDGPKTVGSSVFVRNLPHGMATAEHLAAIFAEAGQVASVQVDPGPLPTASVGFLRQDAALEAERRFHGRWLQGSQLKVSVKENSTNQGDGGDEDFWRRELKSMPKRPRRAFDAGVGSTLEDYDDGLRRRVKGRGTVAFGSHDQRRPASHRPPPGGCAG